MRDTYEDQLSAARYKAERDQARQRIAGLMKSVDDLDDENERLRDMLNGIAWKLGLGDEVHYLSDDDYAECQQAVLAAINRLVDPADVAQLTHSAYDLLTEEDREALRLVRSNGGAEEMERSIDVTCRQAEDGRLFALSVARLLHAFEEVYGDGGLAERDDMGDLLLEELEKRLMPEGMEWPRYEDGEPVLTGSVAEFGSDDSMTVMGVELANGGFILHGRNGGIERPCQAGYRYGKRVKRPVVLAADGEPLEAGQVVWDANGDEFRVLGLYGGPVDEDFPDHTVRCRRAGAEDYESTMCEPSQLTHQRPVLDADGNRIETAMDVWWVCEGDERGIHAEKLHVESIGEDGLVTCAPLNGGTWVVLEPSELHVHKPVLDADGVPIKVGDTVYIPGEPDWYTVTAVDTGFIEVEFLGSRLVFDENGLTHTKPEQDSWERIEEDLSKNYTEYWGCRGLMCNHCPAEIDGKKPHERLDGRSHNCVSAMRRDLVRRCKALAERGER